jgi:iron complex outermembrane receptor protein
MKTMYRKFLYVLILLPFLAFAQGGAVSGTVTDGATGMPLPGVNIIVKGTTNGATTDFDGNYTLSRLTNGDAIEFSYIGYVTSTSSYNGQTRINVTLEEDTGLLEGVTLVAIGYGTVQKRDLTGAVTQISTKDFNKGANVTAENLLNGKVAGLSINTSGAPGSGSEIRIRGGASLNASNDPLIVIDGLPISNQGVAGSTSILSSINPNDIESISVLKDASATAIYGLRGANGVIIINTKRAGKTLQVEFNTQYGSGRRFNEVDVLSSNQYRDLLLGPVTGIDPVTQQPIRQGGIGTPAEIANIGNANTNWQDEIYRRTDFIDSNLSIRGS